MPDGWEVTSGLDPLLDDAAFDDDGDGLENTQEYQYGTLPRNPDTDGDGAEDGLEVSSGTDPLNPTSTPQVANDPTLLVLTIIAIAIAGFACFLVILLFLNSKRTGEQISRQLQELRSSIGKAGSKDASTGYVSTTDAKSVAASEEGKDKDSIPKKTRPNVKAKTGSTK